jgi:hypothetical protein
MAKDQRWWNLRKRVESDRKLSHGTRYFLNLLISDLVTHGQLLDFEFELPWNKVAALTGASRRQAQRYVAQAITQNYLKPTSCGKSKFGAHTRKYFFVTKGVTNGAFKGVKSGAVKSAKNGPSHIYKELRSEGLKEGASQADIDRLLEEFRNSWK